MYSECMGSLLQIRDVPDASRQELKARAAAAGKSLNGYLLDLIEREVAQPTVAEVLDRAARRSERASASALPSVLSGRAERESARDRA
jgi:plasmid stability protein